LLLGILLGLVLQVSVSYEIARYTAVGIIAAVDSVFGAIRAELEGTFSERIFISGFITNTLVAILLTFVGDRLGLASTWSRSSVSGSGSSRTWRSSGATSSRPMIEKGLPDRG
jgi:small basic protein